MIKSFQKKSIQPQLKPSPSSVEASAVEASLGVKVLSAAVADSINGVAITDLCGKHIYVNSAWEKMWGYTFKESVGMLIPEMVAKEELPRLKKEILPSLMNKGSWSGDCVVLRKDGTKFIVSLSVSLIKDGSGKPIGTMAFFTDITRAKRSEEKLKKSEEKFKTLVESSPDCIKLFDTDGKLQYMSPSGLREHGFKDMKDAIGWNFMSSVIKWQRPMAERAFEKALGGETYTFELRHSHGKATREYCLETYSPIKDSDGKVVSIFGVSRSLTELKKTQEQIVQFANLTKKNLNIIIPVLQKISNGDFSAKIKIPKRKDEFTNILLTLNLMIKDLKRAHDYEVKHALDLKKVNLAIRNVFDDLKTEKLRTETEKVRGDAILSSIGDGIIAVSPNGEIIIMNKVAERLLGWKIGDALGRSYDDVIKMEDEKGSIIPFNERPLAKVFASATAYSSSINAGTYFYNKKNIKFPVSINATPIILGNTMIGAVEVFRDITKEKEMMQAKDDFLNIAAHDLRTPVSVIRGNCEMILEGDFGEISPRMKTALSDINIANLKLLNMINTFLTVSRLEKGKIAIIPHETDLKPILTTIIKQMERRVQSANLKFNCKIPKSIPKVMADADRINEVIINILDNSIKFTDRGHIGIWVLPKKDSVVVAIEDTGIGVTKERQKTLFQKYVQVDAEDRVVYGKGAGLGLGLYISRLIVEGCGGKIGIMSTHGKGSTFYFSLPLAKNKKKIIR